MATQRIEIGLWDDDIERVKRMHSLLEKVLRNMRIPAYVCTNCEPPQLGRSNLFGRFPVLEINGDYWSRRPGVDFTEEQLEELFNRLLSSGSLTS